ncbi:hypothetical protein EST38_g12892 [Candolleomyces aberdarensis]|uniref:Uncharacterized protein n=1 Tax=Candolleomyces aberdarensis TaxID=2316362 RepID=A0A4Q2D2G6_9AGAR|nr:hypothetical protein EST38_g12892 [Candolleomyces aberdarensis]
MVLQNPLSGCSSSSRSAVINRAPTKTLAGLGSCRTSQEVKQANEAVAAAAEKARERARVRQESIQQRIGQIEDELQCEDVQRKKVSTRPDLHKKATTGASSESATSAGTSSKKTKAADPRPGKLKIVIKPKAASATKATVNDGEGPEEGLTGVSAPSDSGQLGDDDELPKASEGETAESADHDFGELPGNGDLPVDSESQSRRQVADLKGSPPAEGLGVEVSFPPSAILLCQPKKKKAEKGLDYRTEVNSRRKTSSTSAINKTIQTQILKRKQREIDDPAPSKRSKHEEPSGLLKNFRSQLPTKRRASATSSRRSESVHSEGNNIDEYNGSAFDEDEDDTSLELAR